MAVLEGRDLTKTYREGRHEVPVLHGVSLAVARGEVVALVGPSGSGKTTLLSILGCLLTPTGGQVVIDGQRIDAGRPERLREVRRRSIGFVFQQFNLFPSLTASENVEYALNIKGWRGPQARREADRVLEAVGLGDRKDFRPRDLSGGQRQRIAVARAVAGPSAVILADEPTGNLDSESGSHVLALVRDLSRVRGPGAAHRDPRPAGPCRRRSHCDDSRRPPHPLRGLNRCHRRCSWAGSCSPPSA